MLTKLKTRLAALAAFAIVAAGGLVVGASAPAEATYYSGGVGTNQFSVQITGVNSTWNGYLKNGITKWSATYSETGTSIANSSNSPRKMTASNYNTTWLGLYTPSGTRSNRSFTIKANASRINDMTGGTFARWAKFTSTHELGHALSLADNPNTTRASVMKYRAASSDPGSTPYSYDRDEVVRIY
ncbi:hypothetical protein [Isoptericola jiangsuensis]|uniref:hypothetical protein n=1 Tax=Isoptericola jiangsuensis TaxID=548579 RepID=UPI00114571DF|nr:hypothetical protein [Isoptericola jiangsuensis]